MESPQTLIIKGEIFRLDRQNLRNGQILYKFDLYDGTDSLTVKAMIRDNNNATLQNNNGYGNRSRPPLLTEWMI
jgi:DNA polymerase III alpha subunit (gram-positive type)